MEMKYIKRRKKRPYVSILICFLVLSLGIFAICMHIKFAPKQADIEDITIPEYVQADYVPMGIAHSRNGLKLEKVKNIVIHYVGNPNTTAKQNRNYFASAGTKVNSHFIVGLDGEVLQCIPLNERSSASNWRNKDTISIEVCHPDATGKFNAITLNRLKELTAWLCESFNLSSEDVIRHYDITEKKCPLYFVEHENEWINFKDDVKTILETAKS